MRLHRKQTKKDIRETTIKKSQQEKKEISLKQEQLTESDVFRCFFFMPLNKKFLA